MTMVRRLLAVFAFLGVAAMISSTLQGQSGKTTGGTTPKLTPQLTPAAKGRAGNSPRRSGGLALHHSRHPNLSAGEGDGYFAMQVKPPLEAVPQRPRDFLIMLSTAGTQAGASWIAGHQIAESIIESAKEFDRVSPLDRQRTEIHHQ